MDCQRVDLDRARVMRVTCLHTSTHRYTCENEHGIIRADLVHSRFPWCDGSPSARRLVGNTE